jgi:hypothetical protein
MLSFSVWFIHELLEAREFHKVLRRHEESNQCNKTSLFSLTTKVHENKQHCTSQNAMIMNTLVQHKQQINVLEVECSMLRNMVSNISKGSHYVASNHKMWTNSVQVDFKEEDIAHQLMEDMDLGNHDPHPSNIG